MFCRLIFFWWMIGCMLFIIFHFIVYIVGFVLGRDVVLVLFEVRCAIFYFVLFGCIGFCC